MNKILTILLIISVVWSCKTQQKVDDMSSKKEIITIDYSAGPPTLIYKTKSDYNNLVPITLSDDKSKVSAYPAPKDIYYKGKLAIPTILDNGYLLDNRGISSNVAFLSITYEEYSNLDKAPTVDEIFEMIIDKNPLIELYNCGNRYQYKNEVIDLNKMIFDKQLKRCRKIAGK